MKKILNVEYTKGQCLDIYLPEEKGFKTIVYFHGGGIQNGDKQNGETEFFAESFAKENIAFVTVNYTMYPTAKFPLYLEEAAKATKYVFDHIQDYGGDTKEIYLSGQSAGAWIIMMLCTDHHYLLDVGIDPLSVKGWISDAAQLTSHFNVISIEDHLNPLVQRIDTRAPLYFIDEKFNSNPILLLYYEQDMPNRLEQNKLFVSTVKNLNSKVDIEQIKLEGPHCHGSTVKNKEGTYDYLTETISWIKRHN